MNEKRYINVRIQYNISSCFMYDTACESADVDTVEGLLCAADC